MSIVFLQKDLQNFDFSENIAELCHRDGGSVYFCKELENFLVFRGKVPYNETVLYKLVQLSESGRKEMSL